MSREALSQAEIDALLKSLQDEPHIATSVLSDADKNALTEFGNILFGSGATALTTLLGAQVTISTAKVAASTKRTLGDEIPGRSVVAEAHVTSTFSGNVYLVIEEAAMAAAADLMSGGEGTASELAESQMPMARELISQLTDSCASAVGTLVVARTNIQLADVTMKDLAVDDLSVQFLPDDMLIKLVLRWQVGDKVDSQMLLILPQAMSENIIAELNGTGPAPAPSPGGAGVPTAAVTSPDAAAALVNAATPARAPAPRPAARAAAAPRTAAPPVMVQPAEFSEFSRRGASESNGNIDLLRDVPLNRTVELGRTKKTIREILSLGPGSVVELEKLAGETVDILVGGKLIAKGEVVVIDENFAVRITDIVSPVDRLNSLR